MADDSGIQNQTYFQTVEEIPTLKTNYTNLYKGASACVYK